MSKILEGLEELPDRGDLMTIDDFVDECKSGLLIDYDGVAHPVVNNKMNGNIFLKPSQVLKGEYDKRFTHIVWFNR